MATIKYEIEEHLAVLSENAKGWTKELNKVSWNDRPAKYDIRDWQHDEGKMGKGVTLSKDEMQELIKAVKAL
ncbi:YdbC family protein [Fusibacter sp. JL298sf-3]